MRAWGASNRLAQQACLVAELHGHPRLDERPDARRVVVLCLREDGLWPKRQSCASGPSHAAATATVCAVKTWIGGAVSWGLVQLVAAELGRSASTSLARPCWIPAAPIRFKAPQDGPHRGQGKARRVATRTWCFWSKPRLLLRYPMIEMPTDRHNKNHRWTEERHVQALFCWLAASGTQSRQVVFATFTAFQHDRKDSRAILSLYPSRRLALYVLGFRTRFIQETLAPDSRSTQVGSRNHGCSCCPWRAVVACSAPFAVKRAVDRYRIWADAH